jgi:hypothetical protein
MGSSHPLSIGEPSSLFLYSQSIGIVLPACALPFGNISSMSYGKLMLTLNDVEAELPLASVAVQIATYDP